MKALAKFAAILGLLTAPAAWATIDQVCVATNNDLQAALLQAGNAPLTINLMKGNYRLDLTIWTTNFDGVVRSGTSFVGGYINNCASRDIDPASTVITDNGGFPSYAVSALGDFTLDGLTFKLSGPLAVFSGLSHPDAAIAVRHVVFAGIGSDNGDRFDLQWTGDASASGTVRISDSLFHGSTGSFTCGLRVETTSGFVTYYLINDTIVNNDDDGICLLDDTNHNATYGIYNTVAYNNGTDLDTSTENVTLVDDTVGTIDKPTAPFFPSPIGLKNGDPQLNATTYVPIAPDSPSIDSGTAILPGGLPATDIIGNPRVVGAGVDRGAYESLYDGSTVQMVTNTADSGVGSLRQAIHNANLTAGSNSIHFAIGAGCGPHVIAIDSNLEAITGDTVIRGFSQTGATRNTLDTGNDANLCTILEPSGTSTATDGFRVLSGAGNGVNLTVEGMAIGGFSGNGISLLGGSAHEINGNHFGGSVNGHTMQANGVNIRLGASVHDSIVGGDGSGSRNIIGGATNAGVYVAGSATPAHDNQIVNNYIGLGWGTDFTNRGNGTNGIYLAGASNTISDNVIGDNNNDGIDVDNTAASNNIITHNSIGGVGTTTFGNGLAGVRVENTAADNSIVSNTIANNTNAGVRIVSGVHNKIRKNATYLNGGLGIDLDIAGVTANDPDANAAVANRDQNFPTLSAAIGGYFSGQLSGNLSTTAGDYIVDVYMSTGCDASGNGEGRQWLGSDTITVQPPFFGTQGSKDFVIHMSVDFPETLTGSTITATATDSLGDTSEFSACRNYVDDTLFSDGFDHPSI